MSVADNVHQLYTPDVDAMREHLEHLFGGYLDGFHDGKIELAWTDTRPTADGRYPLRHARMFDTDQLDEMVTEAARLNATPYCNVYVGAALRAPDVFPAGRAEASDVMALTCAYADLDDPGAASSAKDKYWQAKPTMVVVTGKEPHTRAQIWWRLDEPITDQNVSQSLLKGMAAALGGDPTVTDPPRVMRLAGSIAWPVKPGRRVELTEIVRLKEPGQPVYAAGHLGRVFPPVREAQGEVRISGTGKVVEDGIVRATTGLGMEGKVEDGRLRYMLKTSEAVMIQLIGEDGGTPSAQALFDASWEQLRDNIDWTRPGRSEEEYAKICASTIRRFGEGKIKGCKDEEEAKSIYRKKQEVRPGTASRGNEDGQDTQPNPGKFVFEKISDLRKLPPQQWLVKGWIPEGLPGIFYGKWAAGKSFIGFDLALHLSYGMQDWHGAALPGEPCHVLVIAREGHQGFVNRVDAFKAHHGLIDDDDHITFMRASVSFMRDDDFGALCAAIKANATPYRLVIVDTVARVIPGIDMNEQQTITTFMERLNIIGSITGASTIGVHHQNKNGGMMGSAFFEANSDFVFEISRNGEDGPLASGEITCTKMKDGEDGWKRSVSYSRIALSIVSDGPSSLVVDSITAPGTASNKSSKWPDSYTCQRIHNFIREAWDSGYPLSNSVNTKNQGRYAPSVIAKHFNLSSAQAEMIVQQWLEVRPPVLSVEMFRSKTKEKGLMVVGEIA